LADVILIPSRINPEATAQSGARVALGDMQHIPERIGDLDPLRLGRQPNPRSVIHVSSVVLLLLRARLHAYDFEVALNRPVPVIRFYLVGFIVRVVKRLYGVRLAWKAGTRFAKVELVVEIYAIAYLSR
jgi:hypothetical protein